MLKHFNFHVFVWLLLSVPTIGMAQTAGSMPEVKRLAPIDVASPMHDLRAQTEQAVQAIEEAPDVDLEEYKSEEESATSEEKAAPQILAPPQEQLDPLTSGVAAMMAGGSAVVEQKDESPKDDKAMVNKDAQEKNGTPADAEKADELSKEDKDTAETEALMALPIVRTNEPLLDPPLPQQDTPLNPSLSNEGFDMTIDPMLLEEDGSTFVSESTDTPSYEEQLQMRLQELDQKARSQAFEKSKRAALPMETYEIRDLLRRLKDTQEAIQKPVRNPPKPQNVIRTISLDPAAPSEVIRLYVGNVTALNIVDVTGAPWPILDVAYGGNFDIKPPEPGGNFLRITPLRDFAQGNMIVRLLRMTTPVTFILEAGGETVNHRFDARIPEYGPNAKMPVIDEPVKTVAGDMAINSVLEGVPPAGAEKLLVEGVDARTSAYRIGKTMYVRTPMTMLSPAWQGSAASADGINVYVMAEAPVILLSDQGRLERARLSVITDMKE